MKKYTLVANVRTETGRKVKNLRSKGTLPASVYGKGVTSQSIDINAEAFKTVFSHAGETSVVELTLEGNVRPVLIHNIQVDPVSSEILHVEFYQVDLKQKVKTKVPVVFVGDAPIVVSKLGVLLTLLSEVEVEALPTHLPDKIEVDVSGLSELDQEILVSDLHVPSDVTILTDPSIGVVKSTAIVSKEAEEEAAAEEAAKAAEAAEEESAAPAKDSEAQKSETQAPEEKKE